jgi:hypothetical protein
MVLSVHSTIPDFSHHVTIFFLVAILETALHQLPDTNRKEALIAEPSLHVFFGLCSHFEIFLHLHQMSNIQLHENHSQMYDL